MTKEKCSNNVVVCLKNATILSTYLIIFWGLYRFLFKLPDEIEEVVIKPFFWLIPTFYFVFKEKEKLSSLGITLKNLFPAIYYSLGLGVIFVVEALIVNYLKYGNLEFEANIGQKALLVSLVLSFATAISEEITFRGYIFTRIWKAFKSEWFSNVLTTIVWILIHIPITIFVLKLDFNSSMTYLMLTAVFSLGSGFVFARTRNIASSIFLHVLWEWPILLFR